MLNNKLTWNEIKQKYPHQNVGLVNVEYVIGCSGAIKSAIVACTDNDTDLNEMRLRAIQGEVLVHYTTLDEDTVYYNPLQILDDKKEN